MDDDAKLTLSNFLHCIIPSWRKLKFVKWDDGDAITHDPLRMCINNLTWSDLT
jgi:hypothetical protein